MNIWNQNRNSHNYSLKINKVNGSILNPYIPKKYTHLNQHLQVILTPRLKGRETQMTFNIKTNNKLRFYQNK